ncbi:MAG: DUF4124 domain-containing protein [Desulfobacterales bacterium]|nr:DUF4124 domain-containing protein [Desulfobacterales bacterium]
MKNPIVWLAALAALWFAGISSAETVYYWTDENGVRHFSNTGAPDGVGDVGSIAGSSSPPETEEQAEDPNEQSPDADLEDENRADKPDSTDSPPSVREQFENAQREQVARRSEEERRRLEGEIAQIEGRGLSRTFTEGMRAARLEPLKEQLALLEADPVQYFRMKQQGAFVQGGRTSSNRDRRGGRTGAMRDGLQNSP